MQRRDQVGTLGPDANFEEIVTALTRFPLGLVCIVDASDVLLGVISDGDVRRAVLERRFEVSADELMTREPLRARESDRLGELVDLMEGPERKVYAVPVLNEQEHLVGVVRMHDVLGS